MENHVFVTYSRADQAYVDELVAAFSQKGIKYWIDRYIDYGSRWPQVIRQQLDASAVVVVVMTPDAENSIWVGREIDQAESTGRPILPLLLRGSRFFRLAEHQYEDVRTGVLPSDRWFARVQEITGSARPLVQTEARPPERRRARAHNDRGDMLLKLDRFEEALAEYDTAVALDPALAAAHNSRGVALRNLARWEDALESYERAIALQPRDALTWHNKAVVLWHLGRHEEQLVAAEQALHLNPRLDKAHNSRGLALQELKRVDDALAAYGRALELNPQYFHAINNRGTLHLEQGQYELALADFDRAVEIDPTQAPAHENRANALTALGRSSEARAAAQRALEVSS